jgi:hypothetical protein
VCVRVRALAGFLGKRSEALCMTTSSSSITADGETHGWISDWGGWVDKHDRL